MVEHRQLARGRRAVRCSRGLAAGACFLLLLSACAGEKEAPEPAQAPPAAAPAIPPFAGEPVGVPAPPPRACGSGEEHALGGRERSYVARAARVLVAYEQPGGAKLHRFGLRNENDFPTFFGVLSSILDEQCKPVWYHVQLPVRPNGSTGYVRADAVELFGVSTWIDVDLSDRRIDLFEEGRRILRLTAAIGAPPTPTPLGRYYVNQRLRSLDPTGPYGPGAIGISAFSPVLTGWAQGGPIAIHGTNAPSSIGRSISNGCLRIDNESVERLFELVHAGTPVVIQA